MKKYHIAREHLIPKQLERNGLTPESQLTITKSALMAIIEAYTREAGCVSWNAGSARSAGRQPDRFWRRRQKL